MKIRNLIDHYEQDKRGACAPKLAAMLITIDKRFGNISVDGLNSKDLSDKILARCGNLKPNSQARYIRQIEAVLNVARRDGLIAENFHLRKPVCNDIRTTYLTGTEVELILSALNVFSPYAYMPIVCLIHTGCRLSEGLRLKASDVQDGAITVRQPSHKTKTIERIIPLSSKMIEALDNRWNPNGRDELFLNRDGMPMPHASASKIYTNELRYVCKLLGVDKDVRLHDLRHTFASLVALAGGDLADIASMLGHTEIKTTMRYRGLIREKADKLISSL